MINIFIPEYNRILGHIIIIIIMHYVIWGRPRLSISAFLRHIFWTASDWTIKPIGWVSQVIIEITSNNKYILGSNPSLPVEQPVLW